MKPVKYEQTMINEPPTRRLDAALAMPCKTQKRCPMAYRHRHTYRKRRAMDEQQNSFLKLSGSVSFFLMWYLRKSKNGATPLAHWRDRFWLADDAI